MTRHSQQLLDHPSTQEISHAPSSATNAHETTYVPLTVSMAWLLAAPHTWPAAIIPCLIATCAALATQHTVSISLAFSLLIICILLQASANTFNDYYDYKKGSDTAEDDVDPSDAILVYNHVNPRSVFILALGFIVVAFLLGIYVIAVSGWIALVLGVIGALTVVAYSGGKTPISYLPIGELVSGVVMGGIIEIACYYALTLEMSLSSIVWSIPTIIGVGLIMLTNNTCDYEKDVKANRRTLTVIAGRDKARKLYHGLVYGWLASILVIVGWWFTPGLFIMPFMLLASYPFLKALLANPLMAQSRQAAMSQICTVNVVLGAFFASAILAASGLTLSL